MYRKMFAFILSTALASTTALATPSSKVPKATSSKIRARRVITLERGICFGSCPIYKLTIFSDGRVQYYGIRYVKRKGNATGRISRKALEELIMQFTNIYYFNLDDEYVAGSKRCPQVATDMPSATTSLAYQGRTKTIRHYHGCAGLDVLKLLTELENKIDEAVNVTKWTK